MAGLIAAFALVAFPAAAQAGTLASSPSSSNYNAQPYFYGSQYNNFQVTNSGTDTAVGNASITGPDAARFSISGDGCGGSTLMDTWNCNIGVYFNPPNGPGSFSAQLEIPSDGSPNPLVVPLSAQALAGSRMVAAPARIDFGTTILGAAPSRQVTITNVGDFAGGVQQAFVVGPAEFQIGNDHCSQQPLNPGQSCTLTALFIPSSVHDYQGSIFAITGDSPSRSSPSMSAARVASPRARRPIRGSSGSRRRRPEATRPASSSPRPGSARASNARSTVSRLHPAPPPRPTSSTAAGTPSRCAPGPRTAA